MTTQNSSQPGDLFFEPIVDGYLSNPRFVRRDWLAEEIDHRLNTDGSRFVLLTAEPGFGKSAFMAQLAADHPDWPRYFIRRDQRAPLSDVGARSFLLRIGFQLAARYPELFATDAIRLTVEQRVGAVKDGGSVVGAEIGKILASPFYSKIVQIQQQIEHVAGNLVGLHINELVIEPRLLDLADLQHMALSDPARAMQRLHPDRQIVILGDALDEVRYHQTDDNILAWLANCPDLPPNIRFVLTSRPPEGAVRLFMDKQEHVLQVLAFAAPDRDETTQLSGRVDKDLEAYADKLASDAAIKTHLEGLPGGAARFKQQAVTKADGNIGYLDALARAIDQALLNQDNPTLAALLAVKTLPHDMQGLYAFFLHQIKQSVARQRLELLDPQTGETYDKAVWSVVYAPLLGVLAVAREPVTLEQIQYLGGITAGWADVNAAKDSLLQFLDVVDSRYRLYHATLPEFLTDEHTRRNADTEDLYVDARQWHKRIGDRYWRSHSTDWSRCDGYGLAHLPAHLNAAGNQEGLGALLLDFGWLSTKLAYAGVTALQSDYNLVTGGGSVETVRKALRLSAQTLAEDVAQLPGQLLGRMMGVEDPAIAALLNAARAWREKPWLRPLAPTLRSPSLPGALTLPGHNGTPRSVSISPDGSRAASAGNSSPDRSVRTWDLDLGVQIAVLADQAEAGGYNPLALTHDGRWLLCGQGERVAVFEVTNGSTLTALRGHAARITVLVAAATAPVAISAAEDGSTMVWDLSSWQALGPLSTPPGWSTGGQPAPAVDALALTSDGTRAVAASLAGLAVWDVESREIIAALDVVTGPGTTGFDRLPLAITPDGRQVIFGRQAWDVRTAVPQPLLPGVSLESLLAVAPEGRVVLGLGGGKLQAWDVTTNEQIAALPAPGAQIRAVAVSPDGRRAVAGLYDHNILAWDLASVAFLAAVKPHQSDVGHVAVTGDGRWAVTVAMQSEEPAVWDLASGCPLPPSQERDAVLAQARDEWAAADTRYRAAEKEIAARLGKADGTLERTGERLAAAGETVAVTTGRVRGKTGEQLEPAEAPGPERGYRLRVWTLTAPGDPLVLAGHWEPVSRVRITADEASAVSGSRGWVMRVWDLRTGAQLRLLAGHRGWVYDLALTGDGRRVASVSEDRTLRIWDIATGQVLATWTGEEAGTCCDISPDGRYVVVGEQGGQVHLLEMMI